MNNTFQTTAMLPGTVALNNCRLTADSGSERVSDSETALGCLTCCALVRSVSFHNSHCDGTAALTQPSTSPSPRGREGDLGGYTCPPTTAPRAR